MARGNGRSSRTRTLRARRSPASSRRRRCRWWRCRRTPVRCQERHEAGDLLRARRHARAGWRSRAWPSPPGRTGSPRRSAYGPRPGATPTTVIPCGASSTPAVRVSIRTPPLARQYGELPGIGQSSWIDVMLMIRPPPPCLIICFAASWTPKKALLRSTAMTMSNWRSVVSRVEVRVSMPGVVDHDVERGRTSATVSSIRRWMSATSTTSAPTTWARPPAASHCASTRVCLLLALVEVDRRPRRPGWPARARSRDRSRCCSR